MNHLEKKGCRKCDDFGSEFHSPVCDCECHTLHSEATSTTNDIGDQSPYSVLREKIRFVLDGECSSKESEQAVNSVIMTAIDEYRENLAKEERTRISDRLLSHLKPEIEAINPECQCGCRVWGYFVHERDVRWALEPQQSERSDDPDIIRRT